MRGIGRCNRIALLRGPCPVGVPDGWDGLPQLSGLNYAVRREHAPRSCMVFSTLIYSEIVLIFARACVWTRVAIASQSRALKITLFCCICPEAF